MKIIFPVIISIISMVYAEDTEKNPIASAVQVEKSKIFTKAIETHFLSSKKYESMPLAEIKKKFPKSSLGFSAKGVDDAVIVIDDETNRYRFAKAFFVGLPALAFPLEAMNKGTRWEGEFGDLGETADHMLVYILKFDTDATDELNLKRIDSVFRAHEFFRDVRQKMLKQPSSATKILGEWTDNSATITTIYSFSWTGLYERDVVVEFAGVKHFDGTWIVDNENGLKIRENRADGVKIDNYKIIEISKTSLKIKHGEDNTITTFKRKN